VITGDRSVAVATVDRPAPAAGEVLLDVSYCGVCGSDLHMLGAPDGLPPGHVLGHEFTGVVAELGPQADGWAVVTGWCLSPELPSARWSSSAAPAWLPDEWARGLTHPALIGRVSGDQWPYWLTGKPRLTPPWLGSSQREVTAFPRV
jgi:hypothetical protein